MIKVGDRMPDFSLMDQAGKMWSSLDFTGSKVIIYAYPKDSTPGCTAEACNIRDNYSELKKQGYIILGISKDSVASHHRFSEKNELPFTLLSDPDHALLEALGAWGEKKMYGKVTVGTIRKTFIFDECSVLTRIIEKVNTKDHASQILNDE